MNGDDVADEPALAWRDIPVANPWREQLDERWRATPAVRKWAAIVLAVLISGPFAIGAALIENSTSGAGLVLVVVVFGPLTEELVKGAGALFLAEERPWLVPAKWVLPAITVASGLGFAAIENWFYLHVFIENPSDEIVRWRWTFGPIVHGTCSLLVGLGAARLWATSRIAERRADIHLAERWIIAAACVHGAYNLGALLLSAAGIPE